MSTLHAYFKQQGESFGTNADFYLYDAPVTDTTAKTVVYQFAEYEVLTIDVDFTVSENCIVQLFVHDEQVNCFAKLETSNRIQILLSGEDAYLFANIFGQTQIKFVIVDAYDRVHTLYTDYLAVAYSATYGNQKNIDALDQMIHFIEHEDDDFLKHVDYEPGKQTHAQKNASPASKIDNLESVVKCLQNHLTSFQYAVRLTTVSEVRIDAFEKLHSLHAENLVYIATHPEYLKKSHQSGGILVGQTHMMPEKTLVRHSGLTKDNIENRTILSFIYTLLKQVQAWQENCVVEENTQTIETHELSRGYVLCTPVLNRMAASRTQKLALRISDVLQKLCLLFEQYRRVLSCEYAFMHRVVPPTPFILERLHYRDVYKHMLDWFGSGRVANEAPVLGKQLYFASADRLYEYYCLLTVCRLLQDAFGFEKVSQSRFTYVSEESKTFFNNTFVFQKNDVQASVYYEPYIFADKCENGLTLFRTDTSLYDLTPWYTPDIVIKLSKQGKDVYAIFDAKWRRQLRLTHVSDGVSVMQKTILRYVHGMADAQTGEQVQMCWLLQGIDDDAKSPYYTHVSPLAEKIAQLKNASGIVRLTPASGADDLANILAVFMNTNGVFVSSARGATY